MQTTLARFRGKQKGPNTSTVDRKEGISDESDDNVEKQQSDDCSDHVMDTQFELQYRAVAEFK